MIQCAKGFRTVENIITIVFLMMGCLEHLPLSPNKNRGICEICGIKVQGDRRLEAREAPLKLHRAIFEADQFAIDSDSSAMSGIYRPALRSDMRIEPTVRHSIPTKTDFACKITTAFYRAFSGSAILIRMQMARKATRFQTTPIFAGQWRRSFEAGRRGCRAWHPFFAFRIRV